MQCHLRLRSNHTDPALHRAGCGRLHQPKRVVEKAVATIWSGGHYKYHSQSFVWMVGHTETLRGNLTHAIDKHRINIKAEVPHAN